MTPEEFRQRGHEIIDWLADYHAKISDYPVQPATHPGDVKAMLPAVPPLEAEGFDQIIADLDSVVLPNISHWQHPRFFGYFLQLAWLRYPGGPGERRTGGARPVLAVIARGDGD